MVAHVCVLDGMLIVASTNTQCRLEVKGKRHNHAKYDSYIPVRSVAMQIVHWIWQQLTSDKSVSSLVSRIRGWLCIFPLVCSGADWACHKATLVQPMVVCLGQTYGSCVV